MPTNRKFGIEIEFSHKESLKEEVRSQFLEKFPDWHTKEDHSIKSFGTEINSPILSGQAGLEAVAAVLDYLKSNKELRVNKSCGIHVHVDVADFEPFDVIATSMRYAQWEELFFDKVVRKHRIDNQYCLSNENISYVSSMVCYGRPLKDVLLSVKKFSQYNGFNKYQKCNIGSKRYTTVEFRQHHSTFSKDEVINWIKFVTNFVEATKGYTAGFKIDPNVFINDSLTQHESCIKASDKLADINGDITSGPYVYQLQDLVYYRKCASVSRFYFEQFLNDPNVKQVLAKIKELGLDYEVITEDRFSTSVVYVLHNGQRLKDLMSIANTKIFDSDKRILMKMLSDLSTTIKENDLWEGIPVETIFYYSKKLRPKKVKS
jgi:hypothetical protein